MRNLSTESFNIKVPLQNTVNATNQKRLSKIELKETNSYLNTAPLERQYSMKTRSSVMLGNVKQSIRFVNQQAKVIQHLIQQFQLYVGYREQLLKDRSLSANKHAWGVYLMYVQSVHDAMKQSYQGKALFGDGVSPPIRCHLSHGSDILPFDLPDPCLVGMVSIRSFLAGVADHKLPSVELGNACMVELFNALSEVQKGREKLTSACKQLPKPRGSYPRGSSWSGLSAPGVSNSRTFLATIKDKMCSLLDLHRCHV